MVACDRTDDDVTEQVPSVDNISEHPQNFYGEKVTLVAEVNEIYGPHAFDLEDSMDFIFKDKVVVLTRKQVQFGRSALDEDDMVVVSGTVRKFTISEFEKDDDWGEGEKLELEKYKELPVLVADSVRRVSEVGRWSEADEPEGVRVGWASAVVDADPMGLDEEPIVLDSVQVLETTGRGMWLGSTLFPVFAVQRPDQGVFEVRDWVDMRGTLKRLPEVDVAIKAWGLDPNQRERLEDINYYISVDSIEKTAAVPSRIKKSVQFDAYVKSRSAHTDKLVTGQAEVTRVISDRGFYLKAPDGGDEVLAVVREDIPMREMIDIDVGDTLRFEAWAQTKESQVAGTLEADTKEAIAAAPGFLTMYWRNITIL